MTNPADRIRSEIEAMDKLWNGGFEDMQALEHRIPSLLKAMAVMANALEFYAAPWGPHHGNDHKTNFIVMETLNRAGFEAREKLAEAAKLLCGEGDK